MILKTIKIKNIRTFKEADIDFGKTNFITGWNFDTSDGNGVGKSALIQSILLLIGGAKLSDLNLAKLIRNGENEASIEGCIETSSGDLMEITRILKRKGSGSLSVKINNQELKLSTSSQYQDVIFDHLGSVESFKKFRIIDDSSGINILDFTSGQLRKSLMGICQNKFDNIRNSLLSKKNEFEKYSTSHLLSPHAPSEKRLALLGNAINEIESNELNKIIKKINEFQSEKNQFTKQIGSLNQEKLSANTASHRLQKMNECYSCYQKIPDIHKKSQIDRLSKIIKDADVKLKDILEQLEIYNDLIVCEDKKRSKIYQEKEKLTTLKQKLNTRLQQKEYKYTVADIELAKKSIEEIDNFANYYIVEWVNTIEPIVNTYLEVLGMKFSFNINEKGNINPKIKREKEELDYEQLSQGEKIFVSFIFKVALLLENNETGMIIADEGLSALATENLNRIITITSNLPIQLIAVTHNPEVDVTRAKTINIKKQKGVSQLL